MNAHNVAPSANPEGRPNHGLDCGPVFMQMGALYWRRQRDVDNSACRGPTGFNRAFGCFIDSEGLPMVSLLVNPLIPNLIQAFARNC